MDEASILKKVKDYIGLELKNFTITQITKMWKKDSYFASTRLYLVETTSSHRFAVFYSDMFPIILFPWREGWTDEDFYYYYLGFISEYCSKSIGKNFLIQFSSKFAIFPKVERKIQEIENELNYCESTMKMQGIASEIRTIYLDLIHYIAPPSITNSAANPVPIKADDFKGNLDFFLTTSLIGKSNFELRKTISNLGFNGWDYVAHLLHSGSITNYDILDALNQIKLLTSLTCNVIVANDMPIKNQMHCPICDGTNIVLCKTQEGNSYTFTCKDCGVNFDKDLRIIKKVNKH